MSKNQLQDSVVDRIWKNQHVTDKEVFAAFWDMYEAESMREYVKQRWFATRSVKENHITRKMNHFWPKLNDTLIRVREQMKNDVTVAKVFKMENYKLHPSTLGYIVAGSPSEARSKFDISLPVFEHDGIRQVTLHKILPAEELEGEVTDRNSDVIKSIVDRISHDEKIAEERTRNAAVSRLRMEATAIFMSMQQGAGVDEADPAAPETIAENPNENNEVPC